VTSAAPWRPDEAPEDWFDLSTAVFPLEEPGTFGAVIDQAWWVIRGPHGGFLAAVILRAMTAAVDDPDRPPRSFTTHFLSAPSRGPIIVRTVVERTGASATFVSARAGLNGRTFALSLGAFSRSFDGLAFDDATMPDVPAAEQVPPLELTDDVPPYLRNFEVRPALGDRPFTGSDRAEVGGWIRTADTHVADAPAVAAIMDAWVPSVFPRATSPVVCPTIDLTVHFPGPLPVDGARPEDHYLARFTSSTARDGFFAEDGELWTRDGLLIARSRQQALVLPSPR
jgi:acyl-CoA thioesterase